MHHPGTRTRRGHGRPNHPPPTFTWSPADASAAEGLRGTLRPFSARRCSRLYLQIECCISVVRYWKAQSACFLGWTIEAGRCKLRVVRGWLERTAEEWSMLRCLHLNKCILLIESCLSTSAQGPKGSHRWRHRSMLHSSVVRSSEPHTTQRLQRPVSVVHPKRHMLWPPRGWVLKSTESHLARSSCNPRKYAEHAFAAACSKMCKCGHQPCIATASFSTAIRSRPSWGWASRPPRREPDFSASSRGAGGRAKRSYLRAGQCLGFGY